MSDWRETLEFWASQKDGRSPLGDAARAALDEITGCVAAREALAAQNSWLEAENAIWLNKSHELTREIDQLRAGRDALPDTIMAALDLELKIGLTHGDWPSLRARVRQAIVKVLETP